MGESLVVCFPAGSSELVPILVGKAAEIGARYRLGLLVPVAPRNPGSDPCRDEGCTFLRQFEEGGQIWLVYDCGGQIRIYPA